MCAYADDIALIAKFQTQACGDSQRRMEEKAKKVRFFNNDSKTQYMIASVGKFSKPVNLVLDARTLKKVKTFRYLGTLLDRNAKCRKPIKERI